jgi:threonine/homoserine/homoserine lactone efflux protein
MDAILIFFITTVASIVGSLQAGIVNTAVLAHTVKRGPEAGRRMALGGSIPEFIYAALAFQFASWLLDALGLGPQGVAWLVGGILIALGLYFVLLFKPVFDLDQVNVKASGVRKGFLLGMLNPQLILFWSGVRLTLGSFGITGSGWLEMCAFGLGAFTGALLLLLQLVRLGRRAVEKWEPRRLMLLFRAVGAVLVVSGLVAIVRA